MFCDGGIDFSSDGREMVLKAFIESGAGLINIHNIFAEVTFDSICKVRCFTICIFEMGIFSFDFVFFFLCNVFADCAFLTFLSFFF